MTPEHLSYAEARARVLGAVHPLPAERVPLAGALGRALAGPVIAPHALPAFANASMDGYAVAAVSTARAPLALPVREVIAAGHVPVHVLRTGEAARIMTGAMLPEGADAVLPFEEVERSGEGDGERVHVRTPAVAGANVRPAGGDVTAGAVVLEPGRTLSPADLGLAAALGITELSVGTRPRAVVLSTGDELLEPGEPMRPGAIRDSNRIQLAALLEEAGCDVVRTERVRDHVDAVRASIGAALQAADVVFTIGGVSAGDFDPVKQAIDAMDGMALWRVAMKPGRPQAFGTSAGRLFFGLPGNPASVACVFEALARPALRALAGHLGVERPRLQVRAAAPIPSRVGRTDFVRAQLAWRDGAWWATEAGPQVSGHLRPQSQAHALVIVPEEAASLDRGAPAEAILLRWPGPAA